MTFITVSQAASLLDVSERSIYDRVKSGDIPSIKVGGIWRINQDAMIEALTYRPAHPTEPPRPRRTRSNFDEKLEARRAARERRGA